VWTTAKKKKRRPARGASKASYGAREEAEDLLLVNELLSRMREKHLSKYAQARFDKEEPAARARLEKYQQKGEQRDENGMGD
jgi:hypothetical protein